MHNRVTTIPNTNGDRRSHRFIPDQGDNYVLSGCSLTYSDGRLAIGAGTMTLTHGDEVFAVTVDEQTHQLASGSEDIYVDVESDGSGASVVVQSSAPSSPYLQIGAVDTDAGSTIEANRTPDYEPGSISTDSIQDSSDGQAWETLREMGFEHGDVLPVFTETLEAGQGTFMDTTYTFQDQGDGYFDLSQVPSNATPVMRFILGIGNDTAGETTTIRPVVNGFNSGDVSLPELENSRTGTGVGPIDTGWTEVTSVSGELVYWNHIEGKVSGGTGEYNANLDGSLLAFGWQL